MSNIDATLAERGSRYGDFISHAEVTQSIKESMRLGDNWYALDEDMTECLEMVAHKIGRILNGDPNYIDSWTDIIGYVRLVEKRLIKEQATEAAEQKAEESAEDERSRFNKVDATVRAFVEAMCARPRPAEPTIDDVEAALKTLLDAGAITPV